MPMLTKRIDYRSLLNRILLGAFFGLGLLSLLACQSEEDQNAETPENIPFESQKWKEKEGSDYPYREQMLQAVLYTDTIRRLSRDQILHQLGKPDRDRGHDEYLYYTIKQQRIGSFPLSTSTLVIKLNNLDSVAWIKLHE